MLYFKRDLIEVKGREDMSTTGLLIACIFALGIIVIEILEP